jgi:formylglycine-generating enzyme required for sulfatase activity
MGPVVVHRARGPALSLAGGVFAGLLVVLGGCASAPGSSKSPSASLPPVDLSVLAPGTAFRDCTDCPEMVVVPPGRFMMGSPDSDGERWSAGREGPVHPVTMARAFAVGRFEITRAQYAVFVHETGLASKGCFHWTGAAWVREADWDWRNPGFVQGDDEPVACVPWADAQAYVQWLAARTGRPYRLLSEAEWEYAARAGTTTKRYWGDDVNAGCAYGNLGDRDGLDSPPRADCSDGYAHTAPVGRFLPNPWGLHDMLGNVWEWTADCWHEGYAGAPADGSPRMDGDCAQRVNRGAGWNSHPRNVRSSNRGSYSPAAYETVGVRVAR